LLLAAGAADFINKEFRGQESEFMLDSEGEERIQE